MALERLTISLQSGVLADSYIIEQMFDENLNTAHSGYIYGFPIACTVRQKSFNPATKRYSLTGDYDISEALKKYITFSTAATDASTIMAAVATQLGKTASVSIDSHGVRRMSEQTTVMQVLSSLFGWTSAIPHQFVNVFLRGSVLHVLQRGKESSSYSPTNYDIKSVSERKLDTLMDECNWSPEIIGDPDGTYYNGTATFGSTSITYTNGYVTQVVTTDDTTTFGYSADTADSPDDNKYLVSKTNHKNVSNATTVTTTYTYSTYRGIEYLAAETEAETMYVNSQYPSVTVRSRVTNYYPMQSGFYGATTNEESWVYSYAYTGGTWVQTQESHTIGATQQQIVEGRPGGPVTPRQRSGEENTPTVSIAHNPISSNHIPVTDTITLQRYADGLVYLDGKTEYSLRMDCYDEHICDFDTTFTVMGYTWYLQSNQIVLGPGAKAKQSLELVRWA